MMPASPRPAHPGDTAPIGRVAVDGAECYAQSLSTDELALLEDLAARRLDNAPGARITRDEALSRLLENDSTIDRIAKSKLGANARPVRAVMFDKRPDANWVVGWHQDRTIAVRARAEAPGYGRWTRKAGIDHVEPPFELIETMITLRAHLDPCDEDNAPLRVVPGSHRLGRIRHDQIAEIVERLGSYACLASAGDVWLYPTAILHSSEAAWAPRRRRVLQIDYSSAALPGSLEWLGL